jgi:hypothetical protein
MKNTQKKHKTSIDLKKITTIENNFVFLIHFLLFFAFFLIFYNLMDFTFEE